jgi:Alkylmercury lyase
VKVAAVVKAIEATGIPPEKLGEQRTKRLSRGERAMYRWILETFGAGAPPEPDALADAASRFEVEVEQALATLAREDLVHHDPATGAILVAYPFSGRPTAHRVRFPGGHEVDAMCAIDALGIAPMFREAIEIESRDPASGDEIRARVAPDGSVEWSPESAVVVAGAIRSQGDACRGCCPVLNFSLPPPTRSAGWQSTRTCAATSSR